jgi:hypothetical protein
MRALCLRGPAWNLDLDDGGFGIYRLNFHITPMRVNNLLHDVEPEPEPLIVARLTLCAQGIAQIVRKQRAEHLVQAQRLGRSLSS